MKHSINSAIDSTYFLQKIKHADEKKFYLRKAIYEMNKLSYERGTRPGDYLIREKIQAINGELKSYDDKLKICDFGVQPNLAIFEEIIHYFVARYLDNFILKEKIAILRLELINQYNADIQHNLNHKEEKYKRNINNPYREELKKDLEIFEKTLVTEIIPHLHEFLNDINDLLFIHKLNINIDEWTIKNIFDDKYNIFKNSILYFFINNGKINKVVFTLGDVTVLMNLMLDGTGIKSKLLQLKNIDEQKINNTIIDCAKEFAVNSNSADTSTENTNKDRILTQKNPQQIIRNEYKNVLCNLQLLTEYKITFSESGNTIAENLSGNRGNRYIYSSPNSGKLLLKDIADYLKDSLIFINEWLLIELMKNSALLSPVKFLVECLPAEIRFYDLFQNANNVAVKENNQKTNFWGDAISYVTKQTASELIDMIEFLCLELKDAFVKTALEVEHNKSAVFKIFAKKVNIIYDSFEDARKKIINAVQHLDKVK
jgi:hypothetical protein